MSIEIIDILKPKNGLTFKLIEDIDIAVSGYTSLADAVSHFATKDGMASAINLAVSGKQDTLTTAQLAAANSGITAQLTAQITTNTTAIAGKADAADLTALETEVDGKADSSDLTTATTNLQAQIDNIVTPVTQDAEVQNARVGEDGTSYASLKGRLDSEQEKTQDSLDKKINCKETLVPQEITVTTGNMMNVSNGELYESANAECLEYTVTAGETYIITGWHYNASYCGLAMLPNLERVTNEVGSFTKTITIPEGKNKLRINGRNDGHITVTKKITETSAQFWADIDDLASSIDNKLTAYQKFVEKEITVTTGNMISLTNGELYPTETAECLQYPVVPGEKYRVSGWHYNATYCGLGLSPGNIRETNTVGQFTKIVTIPDGVNKMRINGRTADAPIKVERWEYVDSSLFWEEFAVIEEKCITGGTYRDKCGVRVTSDSAVIYLDRYEANTDLKIVIAKKTGNGLPDFSSLSKVANTAPNVSVRDEAQPTYIFSSSTDFLSPSCVYAVNNADGDFPGYTSKLTGGWHMYNNQTTGEYSATARNISFTVYCDGVEVTAGNTARGTEVVVDIVNRLQGSNTEKEDGSGREIVEQHFRITFGDGFKAKIRGEVKALEAVRYSIYYGISTINLTNEPVRFIGSRNNRAENAYNSVTRCGDKTCTGMRQATTNDTYEMHINPTLDLGTMFANNHTSSCIMSSGKSYMVLIYGTEENEMLELSTGDMVYWEGDLELHKN